MLLDKVEPSSLVPNPWNTNIVSPSNEAKLEESIQTLGMFKPAVVRTLEDGTKQILGGEHRVEAAKRMGIKIDIINLGLIDDAKAKKISLVDNGRYGTDDTLKLAELLSDLGSQGDIASFMPYSTADLDAIFTSTSIDLDDLDLPEDADIPALDETKTTANIQTHQIMRQKVPIEDAPDVMEAIESIIKAQGFDSSDSMTNAGDALVYMARTFNEVRNVKAA
jgi:ParB family chromosome partitioning protein